MLFNSYSSGHLTREEMDVLLKKLEEKIGYHFKQQVDNGLFRPDTTELSQLMEIAQDQIYVGHPC